MSKKDYIFGPVLDAPQPPVGSLVEPLNDIDDILLFDDNNHDAGIIPSNHVAVVISSEQPRGLLDKQVNRYMRYAKLLGPDGSVGYGLIGFMKAVK